MNEEKELTPIEENNDVSTTPKKKFGKKQIITVVLTALFIIVAAIIVIIQMVNKDSDKEKKSDVINGTFSKTTYYYKKVDSDTIGPMPSYYVFDKDGYYVSITVSPNPSGEAGLYKIDDEEITFNRKYYYTTNGGLKVTDPTTESKGNVNLGSYKGNEITIYGHHSTKVDESKFQKDIDKFYTFDDIECAYIAQKKDESNNPDKEETNIPEEKGNKPEVDNKDNEEDENEFKITKNNITIETKMDNEYGYNLYINDNLAGNIGFITKNSVQILDDIVVAAGSDTDIRSTTIYFYDKNGKQIKKIYENFDIPALKIREVYEANDKDFENPIEFTIKGKTIKFIANAYFHDNELAIDTDKYIETEEYCKSTKYDNNIVSADFEITYLGNGKFSDIKRSNETKLSEIKKNLCSE